MKKLHEEIMKHVTLCCLVVAFTLFFFAGDAAPQGGPSTWVNIGPAPINIPAGKLTAFPKRSRWSGRVAYVEVDPSDPNHWLIGAPQGGIWETKDGGATWRPRTDNVPDTLTPPAMGSLDMGAIAFAPSQPNIVYAGTGDAVFNRDAYGMAGVLKSTDGGTTWTLVATEPFVHAAFSDLRIHPHNPNLLLAATTAGWRRLSSGRGVFKSTHGGIQWRQKLKGNATDLEIHPGDFEKVYAAIGKIEGSEAGMDLNGVYRSTDGGDTWTMIMGPWSVMAGGVGRAEMAISPSNPNVLYVSIQDAVDGIGDDGGLLGLFRTDNAWDSVPSWVQIDTGATGEHGYCEAEQESNPNPFGRCWVVHDIIVDALSPDTLYAGGISLWRCDHCTASEPLWTDIGAGKIHPDIHHMAWAGNRLIVGNDGGLWSTTDGNPISITALAFAPSDTDCSTYAFGTTDGSIKLTNNDGDTWKGLDPTAVNAVPNHRVSSLAFRPTNRRILYITLSGFDEGTPGQPGHVFKTTNATCVFDASPCVAPTWVNVSPPANIRAHTIVIDPNSPNTLYLGTDLGAWQSIDAGESWVHMDPVNGFSGLPNVPVVDLKINRTTNKLVAFTFGRGAFMLVLP
jgi:photosystem II stability/assembly factor-like uncharacterized protein